MMIPLAVEGRSDSHHPWGCWRLFPYYFSDWCGLGLAKYLVAATSLLSLCCIILLSLRKHLRDVLLWMENLDSMSGCLIFILGFTLVSFPWSWGYTVLTLAAGYLYGFLKGLLVVVFSVLVGTLVAHFTSRQCLVGCVNAKVQGSSLLRAITRVLEGSGGMKVVALARLTPIPFGLQNAVFAVSPMRTSQYLTASTVGLLPTQILNSYIGTTLRSMEDAVTHKGSEGYAAFAVQVCISIALTRYVVHRARSELKTTLQMYEGTQVNGKACNVSTDQLSSTEKAQEASNLEMV
ncbi:transmembrane protein 64-like [Protopterus annectens]|uniref:transmembrane protein 64-like n=1 Tax=Protopterus annectens TaxID=7888 RepID=UPI001CFBA6F3|nr:transmembrane protein 64-like [Protopterus annectens]